ncbi:MAG: 4Fe-4S binding protein [Rhodothermales bacterium]
MAMKIIVEDCFKCSACVFVCPREAISEVYDGEGDVIYVIDGGVCTECEDEGGPHCREECPVPECIVKAAV